MRAILKRAVYAAAAASHQSRNLTPPIHQQHRLCNLIQQLRLYKPPPPSSNDDDDVDDRGKVFSHIGMAESAAPRVLLTKRASAFSTHSGQFSVSGRCHLGRSFCRHLYQVPYQNSRPYCSTGNKEGSESTEKITVTFVDKDGEETVIKVPVGMSMLEAAHENDVELEGACEGSLACSTCHVIVMDIPYYNKLEEPTDEENDMLDLAFGLTETSRLGCQVIASPELDGIRLALPAATRNFAVDGHVPKPH